MPEVLLDETNPYGTRRAQVLRGEHDVYLYLSDRTDPNAPTITAVWVANLDPAPAQLDRSGAVHGAPPRMGADGTLHPDGCPPFADPLQLVWFEEGDGLALTDGHGILAAIPGWGGREGFYGYARHAQGQTPLGWALAGAARSALEEKVAASRDFWSWRRSAGGWESFRAQAVGDLERRVGPIDQSWSVADSTFPELILTRHKLGPDGPWVTATTGVSAQRMAGVEQAVEDPTRCSRIELFLGRSAADDVAASVLADLARIPTTRCTWLGDGHTIGGRPGAYSGLRPDAVALLLTATPPPAGGVAPPDLAGREVRGDPVLPLWVVPVDEPTLAVARGDGVPAALQRLQAEGRSWVV